VRDLAVAGMETTTTFIRWAIVLLTNHVSVQERLQTEIDSVIGRERLPTLDDQSRSVRQIGLGSCNFSVKYSKGDDGAIVIFHALIVNVTKSS